MLNDIQRRRSRVKDSYEAGIDSLEVYAANIRRLDDEEYKYRAVADDYQIQIQKLNERREELEKFTKSLEDFNTLWDNSEFQEKKHFLRTILKEVRAGNGKIEIDFRL